MIPFSIELRKILFRWLSSHRHEVVLATLEGATLDRHVVLRDFKILCRSMKFEPPPRTLHAIRHTFATNYIRHGGSQFMLMKALGIPAWK